MWRFEYHTICHQLILLLRELASPVSELPGIPVQHFHMLGLFPKHLFLFFKKNLSTSFPPEIFINRLSYNIRYAPVCSVLLFQEPFFLFFGKSDADGFGLRVMLFHRQYPSLRKESVSHRL
nr:MAG TPA: hypothetical protein [Bacteriophage sp.]